MLPLRSLNHNESAYVQFQNQTGRSIDIVWVNYRGDLQKYITLKPRENINIDTFKTHPWMFVDRESGLKMKVGRSTVFYPFSNHDVMRRLGLNQDRDFPVRIPIPIRLPMFSLRLISIQKVMRLLKDAKDVESLEIPLSLKRELQQYEERKNNILSKYES